MLDQKLTTDENSVSLRPTAMRYGLILGLISTIATLGLTAIDMVDYTGEKSNLISNLITWGITIGVLYMAINEHKNQDLGGFISLGRCVKLGLLIGIISGIIGAIGMTIYFQFIAPEFLGTVLESMRDRFEEQGLNGDQLESALSMTKMMMSPVSFAIIGIVFSVIFDVIFALVLGLIMKKEAATPFN
jgi:hypothetical protein